MPAAGRTSVIGNWLWAELGAPPGQHKRAAHPATSGFYCAAAMQNDTIFGLHCLPFLFMTSSASSLLDPHDFVPAKPMPSTAA
jgi:hypothetical protein